MVVIGCLVIFFGPMLVFNLRNQFVSLQAMTAYASSHPDEKTSPALVGSLSLYGQMLERLIQKTLFNLPIPFVVIGFTLLLLGSLGSARFERNRQALQLFSWWILMTLPVLFFPKSLGLIQLYIGCGLGLIGLTVLSLRYFSQLKWGKALVLILSLFLIASFGRNIYLLHTNQDVFFITIQDDLNYEDQTALLKYVQTDANGQPYRLKAFTIPYYQEEGWQYLQQYHYPHHSELGAQVIYVVIEKAVDPYWIRQWTNDLGPTQLIEEKTFGKLTVQKRGII